MQLEEILNNQGKQFSVKQVSEALRVEKMSILRWIRLDQLRADKIGNYYAIKGESVRDYLAERSGTTPFQDMKTVMSSYKLPAQRNEE